MPKTVITSTLNLVKLVIDNRYISCRTEICFPIWVLSKEEIGLENFTR